MNTRRDFIQKITGSIIIAPGVNMLSDEETCEKTGDWKEGPVLKVALMGLGGYATMVAEALQKTRRAKLVGLISGSPDKQKAWQKKYKVPDSNCYNYENFDKIKDNKDIDIVYVITPNALHHDQVIRVAQAGKHVISEKPMGLNAKEGQEMIDACKKAGVKLLVGYRMHFEPNTLEVVRMRKAGEFGKIKFFQGLSGFVVNDPGQWRLKKKLAGGGALMDIGIYSINGCRYMIGEEPVWVTAQETKTDTVLFEEGVDETIQFQLGFPGGSVASCLSTYNVNFLDRFFMSGDDGFVELMPATGYGPIKGNTHKGALDKPVTVHQVTQMEEMAAIIFENRQPVIPVDGEEGLRDLKIIDAIYEAVKSGRKVILKG